jgi:hypothetical protein
MIGCQVPIMGGSGAHNKGIKCPLLTGPCLWADAEMAALVEVRDSRHMRHSLDGHEPPGLGFVRVEHANPSGGGDGGGGGGGGGGGVGDGCGAGALQRCLHPGAYIRSLLSSTGALFMG